jgi:two-component system, OmpR family, phosphate regulon response regulator PhoB
MTVKQILIVEDEPAIQELLSLNLTMAGYGILQALNVDQAMTHLQVRDVALMLIDWSLPGQSGVALVRQLRESQREAWLPVIMLTGRTDEFDKVTAFEAGVDDYVTKPFRVRELLARVQAILRRARSADTDGLIEIDGLVINHAQRRVSVNGQAIVLGPTEYRLLHHLLKYPDRVHNRQQLLQHVWQNNLNLQDRTVDVYVARVRSLLSDAGFSGSIETIRSVGYRFVRAAPDGQVAGGVMQEDAGNG